MPEDVARAVGAGNGPVQFAGKSVQVRPLSIRELAEVERECVRRYKQTYLAAFAEGIQFLPESRREPLILAEVEKASRWDAKDLPPKYAVDHARITMTPALEDRIRQIMGDAIMEMARNKPALAAQMLDAQMISDEEFKEATGGPIPRVRIGYVQWWLTGTYEGMVTFIETSLKGAGLTREEIEKEVAESPTAAGLLARSIEEITAPKAAFGQPPA